MSQADPHGDQAGKYQLRLFFNLNNTKIIFLHSNPYSSETSSLLKYLCVLEFIQHNS